MMSESGLVLNSVDCGYAAVTPILTRKPLVQSLSYSAKLMQVRHHFLNNINIIIQQ
jgi:hypothetical protein